MTQSARTIVVIGTGKMASAIAAVFFERGAVTYILGRAPAKVALALVAAERHARDVTPDNKTDVRCQGRLVGGDLARFGDWDDVDLVIESVIEDRAVKRSILADLDRRVPSAIPIGSNSSGFGIGELSEGLASAARMVNLHFLMPAHLVPLVEVALAGSSAPHIGQSVVDLMREFGKRPVLLKNDIPGLLASRLQHALMREALALIEEGVVTPDAVDDAVQYGFGFRYVAMGPIMQKEMSGWDTHAISAAAVYPTLANNRYPCALLTEMVASGNTGMESGKGFKSWTAATVEACKHQFSLRLSAALKVLSYHC
jgi:3-hydroxybutyryl-CoA dehydrogenase